MFSFYKQPTGEALKVADVNLLRGPTREMDLKLHLKRVKYSICCLAMLELVIGVVLLGLGIFSLTLKYNGPEKNHKFTAYGIVLIVTAAISLINGIFGIIGSIKENQTCLTVHGIWLCIGVIGVIFVLGARVIGIEYIWLPLFNTPRLVEVVIIKYLLKAIKDEEVQSSLKI